MDRLHPSRPDTSTPGRIVAHRGARQVAPENTLSAFRAAAQQGARWLEFDVSLLGDGTAVLHHDETLDRCTDARGPLTAIAAGDLARIDAGSWFGPAFRGEPLPTLEQGLEVIGELGLSANLEMKPHDAEPEPIARAVAQALARRPWTEARILVSSYDLGALSALRALLPSQPLAVLYDQPPSDWPDRLGALRASSLHIWYEFVTADVLARAAADRFHVRVVTINEPDRMLPFRAQGLTGVITDHPPLFLDDPAWRAWGRDDQAE
jgi:glycerophosphoryl diester phosphodiesterase